MTKLKKGKSSSILFVNYNNTKLKFLIKKNLEDYIYNILSTLAVISIYFDLNKLTKSFFMITNFPKEGEI